MRKILLSLIFLVGIVVISGAGNVLILNNAFSRPGDTVEVSVSIANTDKFISFQFDLPLPENVTFLGYSLTMSQRSANHVAIGNMVGTNLLRIFSYSPNNAAFTGNDGEVVSFKLVVGAIRGEFPMTLENGIIGDSLSKNVLSGVENGVLAVFPVGIEESPARSISPIKSARIYPNPIAPFSVLSIELTSATDLSLEVRDNTGRLLYNESPGTLLVSFYQYDLGKKLRELNARGVYFLRLFSRKLPDSPVTTVPFVIE